MKLPIWQHCVTRCCQVASVTYLLVPVDHAVLADVDPVLEAELVRHLPLRALAESHRGSEGGRSVQGDQSGCAKPPIDIKTKVMF